MSVGAKESSRQVYPAGSWGLHLQVPGLEEGWRPGSCPSSANGFCYDLGQALFLSPVFALSIEQVFALMTSSHCKPLSLVFCSCFLFPLGPLGHFMCPHSCPTSSLHFSLIVILPLCVCRVFLLFLFFVCVGFSCFFLYVYVCRVFLLFLSFFKDEFIVFVCVCTCTMCVLGSCGSQKSASDLLELELQMVVSYHVDGWELNLSPLQEQPVL